MGFFSDPFDEHLMECINETHFVMNMNNQRTLGFKGETIISYVEVMSTGDSMIWS